MSRRPINLAASCSRKSISAKASHRQQDLYELSTFHFQASISPPHMPLTSQGMHELAIRDSDRAIDSAVLTFIASIKETMSLLCLKAIRTYKVLMALIISLCPPLCLTSALCSTLARYRRKSLARVLLFALAPFHRTFTFASLHLKLSYHEACIRSVQSGRPRCCCRRCQWIGEPLVPRMEFYNVCLRSSIGIWERLTSQSVYPGTETWTTYTTVTTCPLTTSSGTAVYTTLTTSTIVVTSCKGGCPKPPKTTATTIIPHPPTYTPSQKPEPPKGTAPPPPPPSFTPPPKPKPSKGTTVVVSSVPPPPPPSQTPIYSNVCILRRQILRG